jgi:hypothetical protein
MTLRVDILQEQEICKEYCDGIPPKKLGDKYGCSGYSIVNVLKKNNIKIRSRSEAGILSYKKDPNRTKQKIGNKNLLGHKHSPKTIQQMSESTNQSYEIDPTYVERLSEGHKQSYINDYTITERISATEQGQDYDAGEWTGFTKKRSHLKTEMNCIKLNQRLIEGSEGHHLTSDIIIYLPVYLHNCKYGTIHNGVTGKGMRIMNDIAFKYLMEGV